jgi:predicted RNA-binding Zn ribbon-like protein
MVEHAFGSLVGGALSLDFVNTVKGRVPRAGNPARNRGDGIVGERLDSYDALLSWGRAAGVLTARDASALARKAADAPGEAAGVFRRAHALREASYRLFKAAIEGWPPLADDVVVLNREVRRVRAHESLVPGPTLRWTWDRAETLDRVLWPVVQNAVDLLTGTDLARVGQCPGDECGWLFLGASRGRKRQWCEMAACGNLAKVRRFREKRRRVRNG